MIGIYKFTNKYNGKVYIGKSKDIIKRYNGHISSIKSKCKLYFCNALRKYGIDGFYFDIIQLCDIENLNYWEKFYIRYYCSNNPLYGYNLTEGGDGGRMNDDIIEKIRISSTGRKHTDEYKKHMSEWMKNHSKDIHTSAAVEKIKIKQTGKKYSSEVNKKKGRQKEEHSWWGKHHTEESKKKISEAHKRIPKEEHSFYGKHHSDKAKELISIKRKEYAATNKPIWVHKGQEEKLVPKAEANFYINNGYEYGRKHIIRRKKYEIKS